MSIKIINKLFEFIKMNFDVCEKDIIVKNIKLSYGDLCEEPEPCEYEIRFIIHDKFYSILHFEPFTMVKGVNYGEGPYYDCNLFDKETHVFEPVKFDKEIIYPNYEN